ncbi:uncharacterized protein LOC111308633 [Durio zibethinus]|uniref:Uncharacterized protein LOC111308633 n=1 Tax=Durio zibethinus TaxID=66656 RepID=A0A6P6ADD9_DURZI|nr:uncharacterized protein LOC111308633 [Durio zibethinus]
MDESLINGGPGEEVIGDDFYENIEAPKFVDFTAPNRCRTENDDRYWFCLRVGCDQKHEEEMDSEAIYKNFVLRVMAARSPSVRLRKALYRKDSSSNLECPRTVPAKSSKSRVSRLAMISSIPQKMGEAKVKVRPVPKQSATTPNVKAAKQSSTKALTTPRNRKGLSNPGTFQSVRNPKPTTIEVPKNRVVAKALVFHSPKRAVKLKKSVELSSSLRKICRGMEKVEITEKNTLGCKKPLDASRKQLRGREVKSRVYDSLHFQNQKKQEAKSVRCSKKKNKGKDLQLPTKGPMCHKLNEKYSTEMEIEAKSKDCSLEVCSTSSISKNPSEGLMQVIAEKVKFSSDTSRNNMNSLSNSEGMNSGDDDDVPKSQNEGHGEINARSSQEEKIEPCFKDKEIPEATESDDKENALASYIEVSESKIDDKENASASDENRKLNFTTGKLMKNDVLGKHETSKSIQKVTKVMSKTLKENSTSVVKGAQGMKYRKPKLTNPKPFRFRTDERGILKETNLEKKHLQAPLKETTTFPGSQGGKSWRKHQNVQINENCPGQIENVNCAHESSDNKSDTRTLKEPPQTIKTSSSGISEGTIERKLSTTPKKRTVPMHQKTKFPSLLEKGQDKVAQKSEGRFEKNKLPSIKQLVRPRGVASSRKKLVSPMKPGQLGVIKEMSPTVSIRKGKHQILTRVELP